VRNDLQRQGENNAGCFPKCRRQSQVKSSDRNHVCENARSNHSVKASGSYFLSGGLALRGRGKSPRPLGSPAEVKPNAGQIIRVKLDRGKAYSPLFSSRGTRSSRFAPTTREMLESLYSAGSRRCRQVSAFHELTARGLQRRLSPPPGGGGLQIQTSTVGDDLQHVGAFFLVEPHSIVQELHHDD